MRAAYEVVRRPNMNVGRLPSTTRKTAATPTVAATQVHRHELPPTLPGPRARVVQDFDWWLEGHPAHRVAHDVIDVLQCLVERGATQTFIIGLSWGCAATVEAAARPDLAHKLCLQGAVLGNKATRDPRGGVRRTVDAVVVWGDEGARGVASGGVAVRAAAGRCWGRGCKLACGAGCWQASGVLSSQEEWLVIVPAAPGC